MVNRTHLQNAFALFIELHSVDLFQYILFEIGTLAVNNRRVKKYKVLIKSQPNNHNFDPQNLLKES